jgi:beta-mannanase
MKDTEFMQKKNRIKRIYRKGWAEMIKRALNGKYVYFDYSTRKGGEAHAIFAWDEKAKVYRYWWFENTGNFLTATCNFVNNETLFLNWHDTLLIQTFTKDGPNKVVLRMEHPNSKGKYETILEVIFTKK